MNLTKRTPEQLQQQEDTYRAAELLRQAGFSCSVQEYFIFKPSDNAASITLDLPKKTDEKGGS